MSASAARELLGIKNELERIGMQLRQMAKNRPEGWKKEYVQLRCRLQAQLNVAGELGEALFRAGTAAELAPDFRAALRKMRNALALHQASWPVITIAPDDPNYQASMRNVTQAHQEFDAIVDAIVPLRPGS